MGLIKKFLTALTRLLDIVTLFTHHHEVDTSLQIPLAVDHYKDVVDLSPGPVFAPPGYDPSDDFKCNYSQMVGWTQCWTPGNNLNCWLTSPDGETNISTTTVYEEVTNTPLGIDRYYEYNVTAGTVNADGLSFPWGKLLNGTFPGPWIRACWGDTIHLKVNVDPEFQQGVSVHAHGLRQWTKMHMDGVPGITQCPIAPGSSFEYVWNTTQYGSSWYHSHYSLQYPDGLQGPLTIHGPSTKDFDSAPALPLILTDWNHDSAFNGTTRAPCILLGGVGDVRQCQPGTANDSDVKGPFKLNFQKGSRYLLRVINTAYQTGFVFSIDNHQMWVVSADFVPITPYQTDSIFVNIGQRYNLVVEANPTSSDTNFWIRTYQSLCGMIGTLGPNYMNTGIISYDNFSGPPTSTQWPDAQSKAKECKDEPLASILPVVTWTPPPPSNADAPRVIKVDSYPVPGLFYAINAQNAAAFQPLQAQWSNPTFINLNVNSSNLPNTSVIVPEDFSSDFNNVTSLTSKWIYMNIISDNWHPIHLHGHDFAIFNLTYSDNTTEPVGASLPRRDVVTVPSSGSVTIAFPADNPGAWLLHCHIAGHASGGLDLQVLEDQAAANVIWPTGTSPALATASALCSNWSSWCGPNGCAETDSGV